MLSQECVREFKQSWLPNITDQGLERLIALIETDSPFLVHGCFARAIPMGCLATHAAWHHPRTTHLTMEAGITWLHRIAGLNPATSAVIREWDGQGCRRPDVRAGFLALLREEQQARHRITTRPKCPKTVGA